MRTAKMTLAMFCFVLVALALFSIGATVAQDDTVDHMRWDILAVSVNDDGIVEINAGGVAYAEAEDHTIIMMTGSGTFGPDMDDAVEGGGNWTVFDRLGAVLGTGTYTVTSLVSYTPAPGRDTAPLDAFIDHILLEEGSAQEDYRAGVAVFGVTFEDELGNTVDTGALIVSCLLIADTPPGVFEGIMVTKGYVGYWSRIIPVPMQTPFSYTQFTTVHAQ